MRAIWVVASLATAVLVGCSASSIRVTAPGTGSSSTGTVVVTVVSADTLAATGVEVIVIVGGERATIAAGEQTITIPDVPFGDFTSPNQPVQPLTVTARGFVTRLLQLTLNVSGPTDVEVELDAADLDLTGSVTGTVTNADDGTGIANVRLNLKPDVAGTPIAVEGATDKDGQYAIGGTPTGNTIAVVSADGFLSTTRSFLSIQDSSGAGTVEDYQLVATTSKATVRGRVIDLITRAPIQDATVEVGAEALVQSGADGTFELIDVPVGDQIVNVSAPGYDPIVRNITVLPGLPELQFELAPTQAGPPGGPATISGKVTILNKVDSSGATVKAILVATGQTTDEVVTDADGNYGLFVPPGQYRIEVSFQTVSIAKTVTLGGAGRALTGVDFQITAP